MLYDPKSTIGSGIIFIPLPKRNQELVPFVAKLPTEAFHLSPNIKAFQSEIDCWQIGWQSGRIQCLMSRWTNGQTGWSSQGRSVAFRRSRTTSPRSSLHWTSGWFLFVWLWQCSIYVAGQALRTLPPLRPNWASLHKDGKLCLGRNGKTNIWFVQNKRNSVCTNLWDISDILWRLWPLTMHTIFTHLLSIDVK